MATRPSRASGFTLIEMMVVVAIVAVLAALAVASYQGIGTRTSPQNAAFDLQSAMAKARARAAERNSNVVVVLFPNKGHSGATGNGAWVIYEDPDNSFNIANITNPEDLVNTGNDVVNDRKFLDDYQGKNAKFGVPVSGISGQMNFGAPFSGITYSTVSGYSNFGCSFCGSSRGAIVFTPEGGARFEDDSGTWQSTGPGVFALADNNSASNIHRGFVFAISRATSYVALYTN